MHEYIGETKLCRNVVQLGHTVGGGGDDDGFASSTAIENGTMAKMGLICIIIDSLLMQSPYIFERSTLRLYYAIRTFLFYTTTATIRIGEEQFLNEFPYRRA